MRTGFAKLNRNIKQKFHINDPIDAWEPNISLTRSL